MPHRQHHRNLVQLRRCASRNYVHRVPADTVGRFDYFVSDKTADYLKRTCGIESMAASNEGRTLDYDFTVLKRQLQLDGPGGLIEALGSLDAVDRVLAHAPLLKVTDAFVDAHIAHLNAQSDGFVKRACQTSSGSTQGIR